MTQEENFIGVPGGRVFSKAVYTNKSNPPLLILHGGPGGHCRQLEWALKSLAKDYYLIFYDQLGSGFSKVDNKTLNDDSVWQISRFVDELKAVVSFYGLSNFNLFGVSWGGALALEYALTVKPNHLNSLILASPLISTRHWVADAIKLKGQLPPDIQDVLALGEKTGDTDSPAYKRAEELFNSKHLLRKELLDPERIKFNQESQRYYNSHIYEKMWGVNEFFPTGNLSTFDRYDDLKELSIPTLFMCGEFDEATPETVKLFHHKVKGSCFEVLKNCSHQAYFEDPQAYKEVLVNFLDKVIPVI